MVFEAEAEAAADAVVQAAAASDIQISKQISQNQF